jgi:hypothetical protein
MAGCRDISLLVSRAMDERLPLGERLRIRLHLLICGACTRFATQVSLLRAAARRATSRALASDDPARPR